MRETEVAAALFGSQKLIDAMPQEKPQEKPRRRSALWPSESGNRMTEDLAAAKQLLIPRNQQSLDAGHDDEAARDRKLGKTPLLPNEVEPQDAYARQFYRKALRSKAQIDRNIPLGHVRADEYDKPVVPTAEFVLDSVSAAEDDRMGPRVGAPDLRYGNATFPDDPRSGASGTQGRYSAELQRTGWGAPALHPAVNPMNTGPNQPTYLEQALLSLRAGRVIR